MIGSATTQANHDTCIAVTTQSSESSAPQAAPASAGGDNNMPASFNASFEFFKMALSMMGGGANSSTLGISPVPDPRVNRYVQAIKNFEVARQMQLWLANGVSLATAQQNAEAYVSRTLDSAPYSIYLYIAASRAMQLDMTSGGRNFQAAVAQGALDLYNQTNLAAARMVGGQSGGDVMEAMFAQSSLLTMAGSDQSSSMLSNFSSVVPGYHSFSRDCANNNTCQNTSHDWLNVCAPPSSSVPPVQAPPPPPSEEESIPLVEHSLGGVIPSANKSANLTLSTRPRRLPSNTELSSQFDAVSELKNLTLPSNLATRVLATKWIQTTYQNLVKQRSQSTMTEAEWHQRLCTFIKTVVEGLARYPEEGCAMRWLSLPSASVELVIRVSNSPEKFKEELPGFYVKPDLLAASSNSTAPYQGERKSLWVPPTRSSISIARRKEDAEGGEGRSLSLSSLSSVTSVPTGKVKDRRRRNSVSVDAADTSPTQPSPKKRRKANVENLQSRTVAYEESQAASFIPVSNSLPAAFNSVQKDGRWKNMSSKILSKKLSSKVFGNAGADGSVGNMLLNDYAVSFTDPSEAARRHARAMRFSNINSLDRQHNNGGITDQVAPPFFSNPSMSSPSTPSKGNDVVPHAFPFVISTDTTRFMSPPPHAPPLRLMTWQEKLAVISSTKKVVGMSTAMEKPYLRLCGPPDPVLVRSEITLHESFFHVMKKFMLRALTGEAVDADILSPPYNYIDEQLRSIRQDFVVQGIRTPFLYFVYSINARINQIYQDLGQFNQCHSQMQQLERLLPCDNCDAEFVAYRLLYAALNGLDVDVTRLEMSIRQKQHLVEDPAIQFSLHIRDLLIDNNFTRYFRLTSSKLDGSGTKSSEALLAKEQREELQVLQQIVQEFSAAWEAFPNKTASCTDTDTLKQQMAVIRAVNHKVWKFRNYRLGSNPFLCRSLFRVTASRFRMVFVCILAKSHYNISVPDLAKWLAIPSVQECETFLRSQHAIFDGHMNLDCRKSLPHFLKSSLLAKKVKAMG